MSGQMKSMPATSSPTIWAAVSAISTLSGWASIVRSIDVPPVDMLPVRASLTRVPSGGDVVELEALRADELLGGLVELDPGQDLLVADAAARVLVRDVDELADGVLAVADDAGRDALGDRGDLAADHEAAVVVAGDVALDDEVAAAALGAGRRGTRLRTASSLRRSRWTPRPWLPSSGLTTHGKPIRFAASAACVLGLDDGALRDGQAGRVEEAVRQALVARDVDGDAGRLRRHRRPDPLLVDALAELDERVAVEADVRDVAARGLVEDRLGRLGPNAWRSASRIRRSSSAMKSSCDRRGRSARRGG